MLSSLMSTAIPMLTVVMTLAGGWFVTARVTDHWDRVKKNREVDLSAAHEFQRLYGEFVAVWKVWNALRGDFSSVHGPPGHAKWACLERATVLEGGVEALFAKLAVERRLSKDDIAVLGAVRQAFKVLRRAVRQDQPLNWWSSEVEEYSSFKTATMSMSVLLTTPRTSRKPDRNEAVRAFRHITSNYHETRWISSMKL